MSISKHPDSFQNIRDRERQREVKQCKQELRKKRERNQMVTKPNEPMEHTLDYSNIAEADILESA